MVLKVILSDYKVISRQCINFDKSTIIFSKNTSKTTRVLISGELGVQYSNNFEKYLSLPNIVGRQKKASF